MVDPSAGSCTARGGRGSSWRRTTTDASATSTTARWPGRALAVPQSTRVGPDSREGDGERGARFGERQGVRREFGFRRAAGARSPGHLDQEAVEGVGGSFGTGGEPIVDSERGIRASPKIAGRSPARSATRTPRT